MTGESAFGAKVVGDGMTVLTRGVLQFRLLILAVAAGVLALGVIQLRDAPVDLLPEFTPPYAEIQTEALGLSAEEVEQLITVPLEADLLNGVEGVEVIRSESVPGLSSIVLVFAAGSDVYRARQLVEERLAQAHALPNVSKPPTLLQPLSSSNRVLMIGLSTTELTPIEQSVIARWTVRPHLMGVPGVANVSMWGLRDQQLQVQVDPARLQDRRVTLSQVISTAGNAQVVSQLSFLEASTPGTGGFIESPQQRLQVRHLIEKIADPAELAKVPVEGTSGRLRLGDVATITVDHQPLIVDAVVDGGPGLFLVVEKFPGVSTPEVTEDVEEALETLRPGLTGIDTDTTVFRPADYLADAIDNLGLALGIGGALMLLGLAALRFGWRGVVIVAVTVPLSVITATLVLQLTGHGLNALVVAGLAAAVTIVVDEAIAPTDQVLRRPGPFRDGAEVAASTFTSTFISTLAATSAGARRPLVYASLIALVGVVPVAVLSGRPGAFFAPMALAYALAVAAALLVSWAVAPALTMVLASGRRFGPRPASTTWVRWEARYARALARFAGTVRPALLAAAACALASLVLLPLLSFSPVPSFADRNVVVHLEGKPGTSQQLMTKLVGEVAADVRALPGVASVGAHIGRAVSGDRVVNVNSSDVWVTLDHDADHEATMAAIGEVAGSAGDLSAEVLTYSSQTMRDVGALTAGSNPVTGSGLDLLTGLQQPVAVRLFGEDQTTLAEQAERVRQLLSGVPGVVDPQVVQTETQPTIEIEVDLERAQRFGVTPGAVRRAEATLLQGIQVGSVFEDQKVFDVVVQGVPATRRGMADIRSLLIDRPDGGQVQLGQVADVRIVPTPAVIRRDAVSRRVDIVAQVDGRRVGDVAGDIERQIAGLDFPLEYHAEVVQQSTAAEIGRGRVIGFAVAAVLAAFLLVQAAVGSWRLALVTSLVVPVCSVGGLLVGAVTGLELTLGELLGLLAVAGLATRTGLSMVAGLQAGGPARDRLRPVLISTAALALLVLPVVVLGPRPGLEIVQPLALVLLGGLVSSALVTLFVLPALYDHLGTRSATVPATAEDPR